MKIVKTFQMELKDGQVLTLDVSDVLLDKVKETFMLESTDAVSDTHLKYFIVSSMKNALETSG